MPNNNNNFSKRWRDESPISSSPSPSSSSRQCPCHAVVDNMMLSRKTTSTTIPHDDSIGMGDCCHDDTTTSTTTMRCAVCVQKVLQPYRERHQRAQQERERAKMDCNRKLTQINDPTQRWNEYQAESQQLRDQLALLRKQCGDMAVRVASLAVENDTRRETMGSSMDRQQLDLHRLEETLLEGSMMNAIYQATDQVRVLRFQWARKVLSMHRVDIDPEDVKLTPLQKRRQSVHPQQQLQRRARGIAKISGLPLPNAGPELYGVLPPRELQSALRLVAMLTNTVAKCLGIVLPHPILLTMTDGPSGDITDTVSEELLWKRRREVGTASTGGRDTTATSGWGDVGTMAGDTTRDYSTSHQPNNHGKPFVNNGTNGYTTHAPVGSSSTSSMLSFMDGSYWTTKAKKALAKATGQQITEKAPITQNNTFIQPSTDATIVAQRLSHATAAILADDSSSSNGGNSSKFALSTESMHSDEFAIALQLLQNNVIVLCIRAGVPVAKLWPAEAMLLNLHELDEYCQEQTAVAF
ncbi:UV radiation resistance protein and autophagy-related subunit 14-domain containing protein [Nitzschia inconspicua]|uniref:UV radiation resistance protein and autophagy-related subunit 14-domain containing protein n=1 Tax=Nitzschia inconspicua TaxID=303405 RepID=A0A9K3L6B3_9STRA|nr:UV radiation resistance protein and autophagy-related subunit 14-domain containing protein [Nitzschia inconspicua]